MGIHWLQHTHNCKMQSIQKTYVASTTLMLKAALELGKLLPKHNNVNLDIKTPLSLLKNSLSSMLLRNFGKMTFEGIGKHISRSLFSLHVNSIPMQLGSMRHSKSPDKVQRERPWKLKLF